MRYLCLGLVLAVVPFSVQAGSITLQDATLAPKGTKQESQGQAISDIGQANAATFGPVSQGKLNSQFDLGGKSNGSGFGGSNSNDPFASLQFGTGVLKPVSKKVPDSTQ